MQELLTPEENLVKESHNENKTPGTDVRTTKEKKSKDKHKKKHEQMKSDKKKDKKAIKPKQSSEATDTPIHTAEDIPLNKENADVKAKPKAVKLCKIVKADFLKNNFKDYQNFVMEPAFICRKCGRVAKEAAFLCSPKQIER